MQKCQIAVAEQNARLVEGERSSCLGSTDRADEVSPDYKQEFRPVPPPFKCMGRKQIPCWTGKGEVPLAVTSPSLSKIKSSFRPLYSQQGCLSPLSSISRKSEEPSTSANSSQ